MNTDPESLPALEIDELLAKIKRSHSLYYKMINIEIWALVETLDQYFPGSWNRFMGNRQTSMKQFLQRQRQKGGKPQGERPNNEQALDGVERPDGEGPDNGEIS